MENKGKIKKECWCGCSSFNIYQWDERKGDITIVCQQCKCERRVYTPEISVRVHKIEPDFKSSVVVHNALSGPRVCLHCTHYKEIESLPDHLRSGNCTAESAHKSIVECDTLACDKFNIRK